MTKLGRVLEQVPGTMFYTLREQGSTTSASNKGTVIYPPFKKANEELSGKVILNFSIEMIFSHNVINIYLILLLTWLEVTA